MLPAVGILEQARKARDPRFDGRIFIGARTTGIYCRPVCRVKLPRAENVGFFDSAAAATEAGYRPCLRCRPEAAPGNPVWQGTSTTVQRALQLIDEGVLDQDNVEALSTLLGVTSRHLTRLFTRHVGASPKTIAQTRRLQFAKRLIDETHMPMTEIALSAGYGSLRPFNDHFKQTYHRSPRELRKVLDQACPQDQLTLRLSYREPYDFHGLLNFYAIRATPGVEIANESYERSFMLDGESGRFSVHKDGSSLVCNIAGGSSRSLMNLVQRIRRMFDVDAIPDEINRVLSADKKMRKVVNSAPGLRLPGAFDPFEVSVRAVVGQQVSVKGATTVMGRIAARYGLESKHGLIFPDASRLADLKPGHLSMPTRRALTIKELARRVSTGELDFGLPGHDSFQEALLSIPGIGPWTAQYIALRARGNPDAFLAGDLVIRKATQSLHGTDREKEILAYADNWRPWRGYAVMHLWRYAASLKR